jgi:hypothetical protein
MKKTALYLSIALILVLSLTACTKAKNGGVSSPSNISPSSPAPAAGKVSVVVESAADDVLTQYDSVNEFIEFKEAGYQRIIIEVDIAVKSFKFIEIGIRENSADNLYYEKSVLFSLDELSPEKPFVVTWMDQGALPHRGISFVDDNNAVRYFYINMSGLDGSLSLIEFKG